MRIKAPQDLRVATLDGGIVVFQAGIEREVSESIGAVALSMGAEIVGATPTAVLVSVETEEVDPLDEVISAVEQLVESGAPEDFKANGEPKAASINRICGKTIPTELREAAWDRVFNG